MSPLLHNPNYQFGPAVAHARPDLVRPLREIERAHIEQALVLCLGNQKLAAQCLGVARQSVSRWIQKFREEDLRFELGAKS